jgi:hypothetical protein
VCFRPCRVAGGAVMSSSKAPLVVCIICNLIVILWVLGDHHEISFAGNIHAPIKTPVPGYCSMSKTVF